MFKRMFTTNIKQANILYSFNRERINYTYTTKEFVEHSLKNHKEYTDNTESKMDDMFNNMDDMFNDMNEMFNDMDDMFNDMDEMFNDMNDKY